MKLAASGQVHDDLFYDRADLNGDSQVDLADIACFAKYYKEDARTSGDTDHVDGQRRRSIRCPPATRRSPRERWSSCFPVRPAYTGK